MLSLDNKNGLHTQDSSFSRCVKINSNENIKTKVSYQADFFLSKNENRTPLNSIDKKKDCERNIFRKHQMLYPSKTND